MADTATSDLPRLVQGLARALVAAARTRTLYPREYPAVAASLEWLHSALAAASRDQPLAVGITPDALLMEDGPSPGKGPVAEAAALLDARDVLLVVFAPQIDSLSYLNPEAAN